ncbi:LysR family transcriptional regulator [Curvibacter gracilis]|uniref:LysR family transcriptional regulator n=1 Tax=Curvibacter gracilis TaxID=230310 RepID=UPI0004812ADB|nr:LysR family transcriptional regulator [Curvibacter gracilis]
MKFDNLADLKVLVAAAETGGFTPAGRRCGLSTAAVSAAIKRLETSLGVRLFERSTRSVQATQEGRVMIDHARRALELVAEGQALVRGGSAALTGSLRLTTSSALARGLLLDWLPGFAAQHPGLEIDLRVTDTHVDLVREAIDVAVRYGPLPDSGLAARLLAPSHRIACASPAYLRRRGWPQQPQDLAQHECLTYEVRGRLLCDWAFSPVDGAGQAVTVPVRGALRCNDASVALDWALQGQGVVYQSALQLAGALADGRLQRVLPGWLGAAAPLYAVLPSNRFVPPRVTALVEALAELFARSASGELGERVAG